MRRLLVGLAAGAVTAALGTGALPVAASSGGGGQTIVQIASANPDFSTLVAAVKCTGLVPALNGKAAHTVFAPTDEAFAKLGLDAGNVCSLPQQQLTDILLYHVVSGSRLSGRVLPEPDDRYRWIETLLDEHLIKVDSSGVIHTESGGTSTIVATNIVASNGVIHVIDSVMIPGPVATETIAQIASGNPDFSTLVAAAGCTGLVPALNGTTDYTVFAPTNEAFAKLGLNAGNVCSLPTAKLTDILLYHVTAGSRLAGQVLPREGRSSRWIPTLLTGQALRVDRQGDIHTSGGGTSDIVATNIVATNGVIHVIDSVLLPGSQA